MFSNILIYFVVIPVIMLIGLGLCQNIKQIRAVAVTGSIALLALSVYVLVEYLAIRATVIPSRCCLPAHGRGSLPFISTLP